MPEPSHKSLMGSCAINVYLDLYTARMNQAIPWSQQEVSPSLLLVTQSPLGWKGPGTYCCCLGRTQPVWSTVLVFNHRILHAACPSSWVHLWAVAPVINRWHKDLRSGHSLVAASLCPILKASLQIKLQKRGVRRAPVKLDHSLLSRMQRASLNLRVRQLKLCSLGRDLAQIDGPTEQSQTVFTLQQDVARWEQARQAVDITVPAHDMAAAESWCCSSAGWVQLSL